MLTDPERQDADQVIAEAEAVLKELELKQVAVDPMTVLWLLRTLLELSRWLRDKNQ